MPTQPQPDRRPAMPELHHKDCGCGRGMISMDRVQIVLRCSDCRQPRITIIGSLAHMAGVLDALGPGMTRDAGSVVLRFGYATAAAFARFTDCMSSDVSRET